ncbi:hypothetical protein, partial [Klebsiella variicola]|uniref:hypothetical protein n=1 Tax=Klebsiella variicola TaxID=244366 RepID=UPI003A97CB98
MTRPVRFSGMLYSSLLIGIPFLYLPDGDGAMFRRGLGVLADRPVAGLAAALLQNTNIGNNGVLI